MRLIPLRVFFSEKKNSMAQVRSLFKLKNVLDKHRKEQQKFETQMKEIETFENEIQAELEDLRKPGLGAIFETMTDEFSSIEQENSARLEKLLKHLKNEENEHK